MDDYFLRMYGNKTPYNLNSPNVHFNKIVLLQGVKQFGVYSNNWCIARKWKVPTADLPYTCFNHSFLKLEKVHQINDKLPEL